ncbi:hypothetical protein TSOC_013086 [Tetrabaena socialis]|uniref:Uncharacterized protein n=1 Tax=Tetrabaena socialis TaxID=47790 RepID=A0A2J7ZL98_9CHLO|nr:hypothetical protein TSOC_013086 [Tetrabaena socialis]|eukprot:PNH01048.1 hypothetical protein TSOC_013086 [Tetrabaena socialis]
MQRVPSGVSAVRTPEEREASEEIFNTATEEGEKTFQGSAKDLVVAFNHGWDVVRGLSGAMYAPTEEEQKKLKQAIKAADLEKKSKAPVSKRPRTVYAHSGAAPVAEPVARGGYQQQYAGAESQQPNRALSLQRRVARVRFR